MNSNSPHILVTRPKAPGERLIKQLHSNGFQAISQPLLHYQPLATSDQFSKLFNSLSADIIIFVSVPAAEQAHATFSATNWPKCQYIAVGQATCTALNKLDITQVAVPELQTSEGLLALPEVADVANKHIIIVRGDGGRELIAEKLRERGGQVSYIESYQRCWLSLDTSIVDEWHKQGVNTILATSNEILKTILQLIDNKDNYWKNKCRWIVASDRIAQQAKACGLKQVICSHGASDSAILSCLNNLEWDYDRNEQANRR